MALSSRTRVTQRSVPSFSLLWEAKWAVMLDRRPGNATLFNKTLRCIFTSTGETYFCTVNYLKYHKYTGVRGGAVG